MSNTDLNCVLIYLMELLQGHKVVARISEIPTGGH